jgi:hypothetical protein
MVISDRHLERWPISSHRRWLLWAGSAVLLLLLVFGRLPIRYTHMPGFRVLVTDEKGLPVRAAKVSLRVRRGTNALVVREGFELTWKDTTDQQGEMGFAGNTWWWGDYFQGQVIVEKEGFQRRADEVALGSTFLVQGGVHRVALTREGAVARQSDGGPIGQDSPGGARPTVDGMPGGPVD